jgi:hypothetical protein
MIEYIQNKPKSIQNIISVLIVLFLAILHFVKPPDVATFDSLIQVDKLIHFLMFFLSSSWFALIYGDKRKVILISSLVFYGLFLELMQMQFFIFRSFEWFDWLADSIGVIVGFFTISKWL